MGVAGLVEGVAVLKAVVVDSIAVTVVIAVVMMVIVVVGVASRMVGVVAVGGAREEVVVDAGSIVATGPLTWKMRGTSPLLGDLPLSRSCDSHMLFLEYGLHDTYLLESICLNALKMASCLCQY